jgi:hypothetical protein
MRTSLFIVLALIPSFGCAGDPAQAPQKPAAKPTQKGVVPPVASEADAPPLELSPEFIKAFVEDQLKKKQVVVDPPRIEERDDAILFNFNSGPEPSGRDVPLLSELLNQQYIVSAYRTARTPLPDKMWQELLDNAQKEVDKLVEVYAAQPTDAEKFDEQLFAIDQAYKKGMTAFAKTKGKRAGPISQARRIFITIASDPVDGTVKYMPGGHWALYQFVTQRKKEDAIMPPWTTIPKNGAICVAASGQYWFSIKWPDGKDDRCELIQLPDQNGKLTLDRKGHSFKGKE